VDDLGDGRDHWDADGYTEAAASGLTAPALVCSAIDYQ
jgi:hypothetical protein